MNNKPDIRAPASNQQPRIGALILPPGRKLRAKNIHRTRTGCQTCRSRRVKCDEKRPVCSQCHRGERPCHWPNPDQTRAKVSRRANLTACAACKDKKLKCVGDVRESCERCRRLGIKCIRLSVADESESPQPFFNGAISPISSASGNNNRDDSARSSSTLRHAAIDLTPLGQLPSGEELQALVQLFFASVHRMYYCTSTDRLFCADLFLDFGFYGFIPQPQFNRLLAEGKAPRELTLIMIANALRFGGALSPDNLAKADAWADAALKIVLPHVFQGFGVIQLMTLLLAQHYDLNRGNFTSAWLLGANCTRMMQMMSLQSFDRTNPAARPSNLRLSPLLSSETLRRVAWSTFYADSMVDGGRYGFHTVDERSYRLQLPCDQASFLANETVVTEPLFPDPADLSSGSNHNVQQAPLDMSAYLLRTAAARRRALYFAFRASHNERTVEEMIAELSALEADIETVITALPKQFHFNSDNMFTHRERLITFILLHVLRHNLFIILGRAALHIYQRDPNKSEITVQVRRKRISHALPIARLISEGLKSGIVFDTHIGVQAYVALEILLFEPRRLAEIDQSVVERSPELVNAVCNLLTVIRDLASRSELIKQLHIEAVHRVLRFNYTHILNQADFAAFHSEYRLVCQDPAEYDFRDFRWAKLERLRRRGVRPSVNGARDESLLEYEVSEELATTPWTSSPLLDALDVNVSLTSVSASERLDSAEEGDGSRNIGDNADQDLFLGWPWLLEDSSGSVYQTGDPVTFWSQL